MVDGLRWQSNWKGRRGGGRGFEVVEKLGRWKGKEGKRDIEFLILTDKWWVISEERRSLVVQVEDRG